MTKIANLNQFRKCKARTDKERAAEENRAKFGRTKAEKTRDKFDEEKLTKHLDEHKRDGDE